MVAHLVADQADELFRHRERQAGPIGDRGEHTFGLFELLDDGLQGLFGEIGVVVGADNLHGMFAAVIGESPRQGLGHPRPLGDRRLLHWPADPHNLGEVGVGKGR